MALFDDEPGRSPSRTRSARICRCSRSASSPSASQLLRDEIKRLEAELAAKGATKTAAEALFRRG